MIAHYHVHGLFVSFLLFRLKSLSLENIDERQDLVFLTMKHNIVEQAEMAILPDRTR